MNIGEKEILDNHNGLAPIMKWMIMAITNIMMEEVGEKKW